MTHPTDQPPNPPRKHTSEYDDPHYHDDVDVEQPANDEDVPRRSPLSRKTNRRPPPRRPRFDD